MLKEQLLNEIRDPGSKKQISLLKIMLCLPLIGLFIVASLDLYETHSIVSKGGFSLGNNPSFFEALEKDPALAIRALTIFYRGVLGLLILLFYAVGFRVALRMIKKDKKILSIVEQLPDDI